uniref:Uncharacterized protein n=1 Tax=Oryza sativa subsp. japonica TaxID=39947 RepID=Q33AX9_ORYSJ|nr:hypothetical protein LOC_Os10g07030 [Oryza sativa Japonica Group]
MSQIKINISMSTNSTKYKQTSTIEHAQLHTSTQAVDVESAHKQQLGARAPEGARRSEGGLDEDGDKYFLWKGVLIVIGARSALPMAATHGLGHRRRPVHSGLLLLAVTNTVEVVVSSLPLSFSHSIWRERGRIHTYSGGGGSISLVERGESSTLLILSPSLWTNRRRHPPVVSPPPRSEPPIVAQFLGSARRDYSIFVNVYFIFINMSTGGGVNGEHVGSGIGGDENDNTNRGNNNKQQCLILRSVLWVYYSINLSVKKATR